MKRWKVWWMFFQISINERLVYRGDFMLGAGFGSTLATDV